MPAKFVGRSLEVMRDVGDRSRLRQADQAHGETRRPRSTSAIPAPAICRSSRSATRRSATSFPLIAALAGIPPSAVESMHPADLFEAMEAIGPLLLPPPPTGATS